MKRSAVLALGMFDGVHAGHRKLLSAAVELARNLGVSAVAHTFENHPLTVIGAAPPVLMTVEERTKALRAQGVTVHMEPFTEALCATYAEGFLDLLWNQYDVKGLVCGYNHHYGKSRQGDAQTLQRACEARHCVARIIPPVEVDGAPVSSTRIRKLIECGDLAAASRLLGQDWFYSGRVIQGRQIGRALGYRTANLDVQTKALPPFGVYAGRVHTESGVYAGAVNIGVRPTVGAPSDPNVEVHIIHDDVRDYYGSCLRVDLLCFVREERRFDSPASLAAQIAEDLACVQKYYQETEKTV